jgi:hypothetical protein
MAYQFSSAAFCKPIIRSTCGVGRHLRRVLAQEGPTRPFLTLFPLIAEGERLLDQLHREVVKWVWLLNPDGDAMGLGCSLIPGVGSSSQ